MSIQFYNAGDMINEILPYSIPTGQDVHCVARWTLDAPREDFFGVPAEVEIHQTGETIAVQFARDITFKFGSRGVIRIKPDYNPDNEDPEKGIEHYPFARTREEAIVRGREIWETYLRKVVESHLADCEAARAAGGAPKSAVGFTKRALKLLNITDPGEQYFHSLRKGETKAGDPVVAQLQAQNQLIISLLMQTLQGKPIDPEALKKLSETPNAVGLKENGDVITSGIATGEIKKPITNEDTTPKAVQNPRDKNQRAAAAEKHL